MKSIQKFVWLLGLGSVLIDASYAEEARPHAFQVCTSEQGAGKLQSESGNDQVHVCPILSDTLTSDQPAPIVSPSLHDQAVSFHQPINFIEDSVSKQRHSTPPFTSTIRTEENGHDTTANLSTIDSMHVDTPQLTRRQKKLLQFPDNDSIRDQIDHDPAFGIYKDNYFVTGSSFNGGVNKNNSDAKFQISLRYRLIQGVLPYNTYLFISYTQKSFWDIYRKSKPFSESNYNPTIGLGNLICRQGKAVGLALLQYEHESNGRDSIWSRSWNRISLMGQLFFTKNWAMEVKLWIPLSLEDNPDIVRYKGYGLVAGSYISDNDRFRVSACITKRGGWNLNANTELEVAWQAWRKINLFLTLQYYNGFGEGMLHYNKYRNMFRIGLAIKPRHISIF